MSLRLRPHTVTVYAPEPVTSGNVATGVDWSSNGQEVRCQVTPEKPSTLFESYGMETRRPHVLLCDITDAVHFVINARVALGTRRFKVLSLPENWNAETSTSFAQMFLEELDA